MKPVDPPIVWEPFRAVYTAHFGELSDVKKEVSFDAAAPYHYEAPPPGRTRAAFSQDDAGAAKKRRAKAKPYYRMTFGTLSSISSCTTIATFRAAELTGGYEVFLTIAGPFVSAFSELIHDLVAHHAPLAPGLLVKMPAREVPYSAVLLAPLSAGSFSLGSVKGVDRLALRVIPLTPFEEAYAADSQSRLIEALRAAGALDAVDPIRACMIEPKRLERFWIDNLWRFTTRAEQSLERHQERYKRMVELNAPDVILVNEAELVRTYRLLMDYFASKRPDPSSPSGRYAATMEAGTEILKEAAQGALDVVQRRELHPSLIPPLSEAMEIVAATHPVVGELVSMALGEAVAPSARRVNPDELIAVLVKLFQKYREDVDVPALIAAGREGAANVKPEIPTADGSVTPNDMWVAIVNSMYDRLERQRPNRPLGRAEAIESSIGCADLALTDPDDRPPRTRLRSMFKEMAESMQMAWFTCQVFHGGPDIGGPKAAKKPKDKAKRGGKGKKSRLH